MKTSLSRASLINLPRIHELRDLIENSLTRDWILRVEHSVENGPANCQWQEWGKPSFAVSEAAPVIDDIVSCRRGNPDSSIRLVAEKVRPRTRLVYYIYQPQHHTFAATQTSHESAASLTRVSKWINSLAQGAHAARTRLWRLIAITGMLFASLLMIEEVIA